MNNVLTLRHAQTCQDEMPDDLKAGFLEAPLVILELIYYTFEIWKSWRSGACSNTPARDALASAYVGEEQTFTPALTRQATRRMKRIQRWKGIPSEDPVHDQRFTEYLLRYVMRASSLDVASCCDEPVCVEVGEM